MESFLLALAVVIAVGLIGEALVYGIYFLDDYLNKKD